MLRLLNEKELCHTNSKRQKESTDTQPDKSWSLEQLGKFASSGLIEARRLDTAAACLAKKSTIQVFWAGAALTFAQPKSVSLDRGCYVSAIPAPTIG